MSSTQEMPSIAPENVAAIVTELKELRATVAQHQIKTSTLEKQIDHLKGHITIIESKLAIAEHVFPTMILSILEKVKRTILLVPY